MENRHTGLYIFGTCVLLAILLVVLGVMTGILPGRDQDRAQAVPAPTPNADAVQPAATPVPTPAAPETTPDMVLDEEEQVYAVTVTCGKGGAVLPAGMSTVVEGGSIDIMILPDEGYEIESVTINGELLEVAGSMTLSNIRNNQSVYVSFRMVSETVPPDVLPAVPEQQPEGPEPTEEPVTPIE